MIPSLAADRNNDAVTLIDSGHIDAAISGLSHLVEGFRNFVSSNDDARSKLDEQQQQTANLSLDQCMMISQPAMHDVDISSDGSTSPHDSDDDHTSKPFVYRSAIRMPPSVTNDRDRDSLMSSIFLFNLALAHQLRAEATVNNQVQQHSLLSKALKIYELAFKMQERGGYFNCNFLFILAILNNIGVIHQTLGAPDLAHRCFQKLLSVLMLITERQCYDTTMLDMNGFFRNACTASGTSSTAAAA